MRHLAIVLFVVFSCVRVDAQHARYKPQMPSIPSKVLVIEVPALNEAHVLSDLKRKFTGFEGANLIGCCPNQRWIFIRTTEASFFNALIAIKELDLVYYIRKEVAPAEAMHQCNNYQPIEL